MDTNKAYAAMELRSCQWPDPACNMAQEYLISIDYPEGPDYSGGNREIVGCESHYLRLVSLAVRLYTDASVTVQTY